MGRKRLAVPVLYHQAKEYANQRFHHHHQRFRRLIWAGKDLSDFFRLGEPDLDQMEWVDNPWPEISLDTFRRVR